MARERTGTLIFKSKTWQVKVTSKDDPTKRVYIDLSTTDEGRAKQLRARAVRQYYAGAIHKAPGVRSKTLDLPKVTVDEFASEFYRRREAEGIKSWKEEQAWYRIYVKPLLGGLLVESVTTLDIDEVLLAAKKAGRLQEGVRKVWCECKHLFKAAKKARLISDNPADRDLVTIPQGCGYLKPPAQLTDAEFAQYVAYPDTMAFSDVENAKRVELRMVPLIDREIKVLAIISRTIGGCRTSDLHAMTWDRIDTLHWQRIEILRPKVSKKRERIDEYEIPLAVLPVLKRWWEERGCPKAGPVFPYRGTNQTKAKLGTAKGDGTYAARFRRDLLIAGVDRRALHEGDAKHRPTVFHALRGAFVSALKANGVSPEQRMRLASHTSFEVHERYAEKDLPAMQIPANAIPDLRGFVLGYDSRIGRNSAESPSQLSKAGDNSNRSSEPADQENVVVLESYRLEKALERPEPSATIEPAENETKDLVIPAKAPMLSPVASSPGPVDTISKGTNEAREGLLIAIETAARTGDILAVVRLTKVLADVMKNGEKTIG